MVAAGLPDEAALRALLAIATWPRFTAGCSQAAKVLSATIAEVKQNGKLSQPLKEEIRRWLNSKPACVTEGQLNSIEEKVK